MNAYKNQPLRARLKCAWHGFAHALKSQASLQLQLAIGGGAFIALIVLRPEAVWWALVLLASGAVLAAELFNTALEQLADELHPQASEGIRLVKDCAAAAVALASLGALGVATALAVHLLNN
jgi:undecaprenol kinase